MRVLPFAEAAELVKGTLDIIDVVSRHVVLKKAGRNHLGLCPFHNEKTPSFNVNAEKNIFKCFGCGEAGDAIEFIKKREGKNYSEIIHELALAQGIEIVRDGRSQEEMLQRRDLTQKILELNKLSGEWFASQLASSAGTSVLAYLEKRQIPAEIVSSFSLGYALDGWEFLTNHLTRTVDFVRSNPDVLVTAGLSNQRLEGNNGYYDRFRNRLIIPIHDEQGRIVAFGGRSLSDEDKPKYLNSPETAVYQKNKILYGLYQAKDAIRQSKYAIVMEGYFDVISAHQGGVPQAVGSCGTALTENHLKLLTRFGAETVYLAFDSDDAGLKAALSAIDLIEPYVSTGQLSMKILVVPDGKDPDDFIRNAGGDAFKALLANATHFMEFKFDMALRGLAFHTTEGRVQAAAKLTPLLASIRQPVMRGEFLRKYAHKIRVSEEDLLMELRRYESASQPYYSSNYRQNSRQRGNQPYPYKKSPKKYTQNQAISDRSRTSYTSTRYIPIADFSNSASVAELRQTILPKRVVAEKSLLTLLLVSEDSYRLVYPMIAKTPFGDPKFELLAKTIESFPPSEHTLDSVIKRMHVLFADQREIGQALADLMFGTESLMDQLGLGKLCPDDFSQKILAEAQKYAQVVEETRFKESLTQMAGQARELEQEQQISGEEIDVTVLEMQYQLREHLAPEKKSYDN